MQNDPEKLLAEWIQAQRQERGWTQADLAERLSSWGVGMHSTAITRLEQGKRAIRFSEAVAILNAFGQSMGDLMAYFQTVEEFGSALEFELERTKDRPPSVREVAQMVEGIVGMAHQMIREAIAGADAGTTPLDYEDAEGGEDIEAIQAAFARASHDDPDSSEVD